MRVFLFLCDCQLVNSWSSSDSYDCCCWGTQVVILLVYSPKRVRAKVPQVLRARNRQLARLAVTWGSLWQQQAVCIHFLQGICTSYKHTYPQELWLTLRPTPTTATGGVATWHFAVLLPASASAPASALLCVATLHKYLRTTLVRLPPTRMPRPECSATLPDIVASGKRQAKSANWRQPGGNALQVQRVIWVIWSAAGWRGGRGSWSWILFMVQQINGATFVWGTCSLPSPALPLPGAATCVKVCRHFCFFFCFFFLVPTLHMPQHVPHVKKNLSAHGVQNL